LRQDFPRVVLAEHPLDLFVVDVFVVEFFVIGVVVLIAALGHRRIAAVEHLHLERRRRRGRRPLYDLEHYRRLVRGRLGKRHAQKVFHGASGCGLPAAVACRPPGSTVPA
jgi:hypothetical protein